MLCNSQLLTGDVGMLMGHVYVTSAVRLLRLTCDEALHCEAVHWARPMSC
jgi:hypothetical protein